MKNLGTYISLLFMTIFVGIASFAPIMAFAEETPKNEVISADIIESEEILEEEENVANTEDTEVKQDNNSNVLPATKSTTRFEEKIEPLLWQYGTDVLALGTICLVVLAKSKKSANSVLAVAGLLTKSNDDNKQTQESVKQMQESNNAWKKEMESEFNKKFDEIKKELVDTEKDTNNAVHKLLHVEEIAYEENPTLVSNGTAKKIAEVIHNEKCKS